MIDSLFDLKFVDISSLHPNPTISRSEFSQDDVEVLAQNFLKARATIKPLIVRRRNDGEYDIVEGHLEFYAADRARNVDDNFEMIQAIILDSKNEDAVIEQKNLLGKVVIPPITSGDESIDKIKNLESHLSSDINNLKSQIQDLIVQITNEFKIVHEVIAQRKTSKSFLQKFNELTKEKLAEHLQLAGISRKQAFSKAQSIIDEREKGSFESLLDMMERVRMPNARRTKAITEKKLVEILDIWSKFEEKE